MAFLDDIIQYKKESLEALFSADGFSESYDELKNRAKALGGIRDFTAALTHDGINIIAEVKKASPSKGIIREEFDPVEIASIYDRAGACAVSVLTEDKYFLGSLDYVTAVKEAISLPVLRKDFIIDPYQVYESRAIGSDALLLIVACLTPETLSELLALTESLGMAALVEVHSKEELGIALDAGSKIVGVNNRNLRTFSTDTRVTKELSELVPDDIIMVAESGINTREDILELKGYGADAFLIGEALTREADIELKLRTLLTEAV
ncbi:MAG: indole-3-glycerol phosphate synthase TrpC [Deltaproteobacteria bacterium]|nr:indole-3-glycerol phosphate synthase TrpC [Deltaproteobacteria bacterium]